MAHRDGATDLQEHKDKPTEFLLTPDGKLVAALTAEEKKKALADRSWRKKNLHDQQVFLQEQPNIDMAGTEDRARALYRQHQRLHPGDKHGAKKFVEQYLWRGRKK